MKITATHACNRYDFADYAQEFCLAYAGGLKWRLAKQTKRTLDTLKATAFCNRRRMA